MQSDLCFICFLEELKRKKTLSPKDNNDYNGNWNYYYPELIRPEWEWALYRIFKRIIDILEQVKTIKFEYLAEMLFLERDTLNKILHYHQKEMIRRHSIQAKKFRIFISHAVKDVENYRIVELAEYLESRKEISHVYYCEEDLIGNIDDWMSKTVPRCQLLIFFSTENSLKSKDCDNEIKIARKHGIQISPVLGVNLKWEDLEELNIDRELGERFDPMEFKSFCEKIYNYVLKYKEDIEKDSLEKKKDKKRKKL